MFFKKIKQHLRIKAFYGNTENAVTTQTWVAIAITMKRLNLKRSIYKTLRALNLSIFEITSTEILLGRTVEPTELGNLTVQQSLFQTLGK